MAAIYDSRTIAERRAHLETGGWGVGFTESGRLISQEGHLIGELGRAGARSTQRGFGDLEAARAKQLEVDLIRTQEQIQERIVDLARQERQIRLDSLREFNRGLLLAGPGEMLQRLQVSQMLHKNVSPGEFFALSPEVRRMYFEARGGESGMTNRMEQAELARSGHGPWSVGRDVAEHAAGRQRIEYWNSIMRRNAAAGVSALRPMPLPGDGVDVAARRVAGGLGAVASQAIGTATALALLQRAIGDVLRATHGGTAPATAAPSAGRMDISAGYALGAPSPRQMTPVPGTQSAQTIDFRDHTPWTPNAAQQAALREAGIQ